MKVNPKTIASAAVILGVALILYGFFVTVVSNGQEIRDTYNCDRTTQDVRETDAYCDDLKSAPGAETAFNWPVIIVGAIMVAAGGFYLGKISADDTASTLQNTTPPRPQPKPQPEKPYDER